MNKINTEIYRAVQVDETIFVSLQKIEPNDLDDHYLRDMSLKLEISKEVVSIPVVRSRTEMWDGGDKQYPHLHFVCPICNEEHNTDLEEYDSNPKFTCCDSCSWNSLIWVNWIKENNT